MSIKSYFLRFQEIARAGSIRAASERLFVTPSALSRDLQKLEDELGVALFERRATGMVLTPEGKVYLAHVRDMLKGMEWLRSELDALQNLHRGRVAILSVEGHAADFLAPVIVQFQAKYPDITFSLKITDTGAVMSGIASGEADIGVVFNLDSTARLPSALHFPAPLLAIMVPDHPLAGRASLTLTDLVDQPLALPDRSFGVRRLIDMQCQIADVQITPALESNSVSVLRSYARNGGGVTLLSRIPVHREIAAGLLVAIPLADELLQHGGIDVCTLEGRKLPVASGVFLQMLIDAWQT